MSTQLQKLNSARALRSFLTGETPGSRAWHLAVDRCIKLLIVGYEQRLEQEIDDANKANK